MRWAAVGWGWLIIALLASANSHAASLGDLVVVSRAGERFDGRIALVGAEGFRPPDITVTLGSKEDFGYLGLERFGYLETLSFQVEPPHVLVSSTAPIPDAYLNFLLRLSWPGGALLREYAVLLDAPGPAPAKARAPIPMAKPVATPFPPETTPATLARTVTVRLKDTLWSIAAANLPPDGTNVQQHMLAILRENPHAFVAGNINGLVAGAILRLPSDVATTNLSAKEAIDEAGRHNDAWETGGRGQLRIIDPAEYGAVPQAATEPPTPETVAEPPPDTIAITDPPPEPPLADLLQEARRQVREQSRQLLRRDDEIARLASELAALRATRDQERQGWMEALGRWRIAALAGILPTAGLIAVGLVALRRRQGNRRADSPAAPDYDFGAPIGDGQVKLNLAKAYIDLNDQASAREVLEEVIAGGTDQERSEAQTLLEQLADASSPPAPS